MSTVFDPDSIAVIGASDDPDRIAGRPIEFLETHGYPGGIYPVNPNHDEIAGFDCYPNVGSIPTSVEFAMVILPARLVVDVVEECIDAGVDTVLVVSSGFAETGTDAAREAEARLATLAEESETTIIGPNSQGMIDFPARATASFTPALKREELLTGPVSFVSQSGAFGGALTTLLQEAGVGFDKWISTGNEAAMGSLDLISELATIDTTEMVAGYVEGFEDGRKLVEIRRTATGIDLPIVVLKSGRSERGKVAAASHTGKIAGEHAIYEDIFKETGVIGVDDIDHFVDVVTALSRLETEPGPRLGVVTTSGGAGIHIADVVASEPVIHLPELSGDVRTQLDEHVPSYGATFNPVDVTAQVVNSPDRFRACLELLLDSDEIDTVVFQSTNASGERALGYAETVASIAADRDTPLLVVWTGGIRKDAALDVYETAGIPVFENPARCIKTIASIVQYVESHDRLDATTHLPARPPTDDGDDAPELLPEPAAKSLLADYGLAVPESRLATSVEAATEGAESLGYPVVAKLVSPDVVHRNQIDGVRLDLARPAAVESAVEDFRSIATDRDLELAGISIQEYLEGDLELGMGLVTDTDFGPVIMLGRGGVDIERNSDAAFRTIPLGRPHAESMVSGLKTIDGDELTESARESVVESLLALSDAYVANPWIRAVDVNPLVLVDDRAVALDALIIGPEPRDGTVEGGQ